MGFGKDCTPEERRFIASMCNDGEKPPETLDICEKLFIM